MHVEHHLDRVRDQIRAAASLGDERTQQIAAGLSDSVTAAVRLAIITALGEAADEITAALLDLPGSPTVRVQVEGEDVGLNVRADSGPETESPVRDDGEATARISLRLSEALKSDIDAAADRDGVSVNTWLVRAAGSALRPDPWSRGRGSRGARNTNQMSGWING